MSLKVYLPHPGEGVFLELLVRALSPQVQLHSGTELPDPCDFEIMVAGRPTAEQLEASPRLRALVIPYAGVPARTRELLSGRSGVAVHNLHHNAAPTAELALALLLAAARRVVPLDRALREHDWRPRHDERSAGMLLEGRRVLVLGYGHIGQRVARACTALGMHVSAVQRTLPPTESDGGTVSLHPVSALRDLLPESDAVIVCLPATPETDGLLGAAELDLLPRGAIVVNVGRASVIEESPLHDALRTGRLGGAGLDCWYRYPEDADSRSDTAPSELPFWELDSVVLSPHRAGHSDRTEELRATHLADLLNCAARGEPLPNRVSIELGY